MRILVISDTHINGKHAKLPSIIKEEALKSDCCLHCGDFISYSVFEALESLTKVYGVCGNMDNADLARKLPLKQLIKFGSITLGLTHGRGSPNNLMHYLNQEFSKDMDKIDIICFGHSHLPFNERIEGKIYFNPGSSTDKISTPNCSYGIIKIDGKKIKAEVKQIG